jgi:hypothetical protein
MNSCGRVFARWATRQVDIHGNDAFQAVAAGMAVLGNPPETAQVPMAMTTDPNVQNL